MNWQAVQILFLKDLFLSRRPLFSYFAAGLASSAIACVPVSSVAFIGFILVMTVAIASGIHLIGTLLLSESTDQTRVFVMSLPVSLLDYSIAKISVVLLTYLIPWSAMFACTMICTAILPWASRGSIAVLPAIFLFLLGSFMVQLVTAVITESVGFTIAVMVAGNVLLNVFMMQYFAIPEIMEANKSDIISWPPVLYPILGSELAVVALTLVLSYLFQTRKRDLI